MSAKNAKAARKQLALHKFPVLKTEVFIPAMRRPNVNAYTQKRKDPLPFLLPEKTYSVEADHGRRIRRVALSLRVSISTAIPMYVNKIGMVKKSEAQKNGKPTQANS